MLGTKTALVKYCFQAKGIAQVSYSGTQRNKRQKLHGNIIQFIHVLKQTVIEVSSRISKSKLYLSKEGLGGVLEPQKLIEDLD